MTSPDEAGLLRTIRVTIALLLALAVIVMVALPRIPLYVRVVVASVDVIGALILFLVLRQKMRR